MRLSLRSRVLGLVFLMNTLVFGLGGGFALRTQVAASQQLEDGITEDLLATIRRTIRPEGLNVGRILRWPSWRFFEDAILVDRELVVSTDGEVKTTGVALNPLGVGNRAAGFDKGAALIGIEQSIRTQAPVENVEGGRVVPINGPRGEAWGGIWFRSRDRVNRASMARSMFPWFALSTLALTLATFFAVRRLVLDPIADLGDGARRVRSGDLSVRLPDTGRRDEMGDLVRAFNDMAGTVQGFNERLEDEVRRATEQARKAEAAAMTQRRLAAMGELAAGIAHEINNPLGGLQNAVTTLAREDLSAEKRARYLELLTTGLSRIGETVNRLRRFTPRAATRDEVDLAETVRDATDLVRHRAERLDVQIELRGALEAPLVIRGARTEIGQAVLNLLANALDALEEGASRKSGRRIDVTLERRSDHARLAVRDNGHGVSADELDRVQDLFYTTKEVGKGTGLGLPLVHNTVKQHGGWVHIESEVGAYFEVELGFPFDGVVRKPGDGLAPGERGHGA